MCFKALVSTRIIFALTAFLIASGISGPAFADDPIINQYSKQFLEKPELDRVWWYMGAFTTLGHLVSQVNETRGKCIYDWYFNDQEKRQELIEDTIRKYPKHTPSGVILALLFKNCGKFKVQLED